MKYSTTQQGRGPTSSISRLIPFDHPCSILYHRGSSILRILLVQIQRMYASVDVSKETSAELSLVRRFKRLISASNSYRRSIRFYADRLGVGVASLNKTVKAVTRQPSGQLIRQEIALEAKRLLVHTAMSAAEIGYQLGFEIFIRHGN